MELKGSKIADLPISPCLLLLLHCNMNYSCTLAILPLWRIRFSCSLPSENGRDQQTGQKNLVLSKSDFIAQIAFSKKVRASLKPVPLPQLPTGQQKPGNHGHPEGEPPEKYRCRQRSFHPYTQCDKQSDTSGFKSAQSQWNQAEHGND